MENIKSTNSIFYIFLCFQVKLTYHDGSPVHDMNNPVTVRYGYSYDHDSYTEEKYKLSKHGMVELNFYPLVENQTVLGIEVSKKLHIGLNGKFLHFRRDGTFLKHLVTCDGNWIFYDNVLRKRQWCRPGEAPKSTPKKNLHSKKLMICVWWDMEGIYTSSYDPTKP
jgi:hypothetical protein